jgi:hypothetical protein
MKPKAKHKSILLAYSPWIYTIFAFAATFSPFAFSGPAQLSAMRWCGLPAFIFGLLGFYFCFRSRHPRLRDLAIWTNLAAIGLGFMWVYLGYF